jgi:hypothetical protein
LQPRPSAHHACPPAGCGLRGACCCRRCSEEEKAARKERVTKAKDALSRSVGIKGDHVAGARAAIKTYLQRLNEPNQPDDARFEMLIEAPFKAPEKKKTNGPRF